MGEPKPENVPSALLSRQENDLLFSLTGNKCQVLGSAVVQIYCAQPTSRNAWTKRGVGVATLIKDNNRRSYFIRIYDIKNSGMLMEQELYEEFKYQEPRNHFHTFEADEYQTGLNFADENEAKEFAMVVRSKQGRQRNRTERRKTMRSNAGPSPSAVTAAKPMSPPSQPYINARPLAATQQQAGSTTNLHASPSTSSLNDRAPSAPRKPAAKNGKGKAKLTKDDIGQPMDFRHVNHVGWDPDKGFDMNKLDDDLKSVFQLAGITEDHMKDEATRDMVYGIIEEKGGLEAIKKEVLASKQLRQQQPGSFSPSGAPAPPPPSRPLPAPPVDSGFLPSAPPPPPLRATASPASFAASLAPPPPPPSVPPRGPPQPSSGQRGAAGRAPNAPPPPPPPPGGMGVPPPPPPPLPPSSGAFGAPPPPPPLPSGGMVPPPPPPPSGLPQAASAGGRSALLSQIQQGAPLKRVTAAAAADEPADDRDALLSAIRQGLKLNKVEDHPASPTASTASVAAGGGGIIGALQMALASRQKQLQGSDDEAGSEDDMDDDDEWDDN